MYKLSHARGFAPYVYLLAAALALLVAMFGPIVEHGAQASINGPGSVIAPGSGTAFGRHFLGQGFPAIPNPVVGPVYPDRPPI